MRRCVSRRQDDGLEPNLFGADAKDGTAIRTQRRHITPRSAMQARYMRMLHEKELVFGLGPAGTGKTYLAVAVAVAMLTKGAVDRIVLSRPAVEAGERLGFLPGDLHEKVDPYLRPLYDALYDMLPAEQVVKRLSSGEIEIAPLAFMRGRTLAHSFVILDEAQNTTAMQMKMFLTRLGENSRMVVTGDLTQIDLPSGTKSGLKDALEAVADVPDIGITQFTEVDVVRHHLVAKIVQAYDKRDRKAKKPAAAGSQVIDTDTIEDAARMRSPRVCRFRHRRARRLAAMRSSTRRRCSAAPPRAAVAAARRARRSRATLDSRRRRGADRRPRDAEAQQDLSRQGQADQRALLSRPANRRRASARRLGDVAIALGTVKREAKAQGKSVPDHLTHLMVHAVLHLLGYDHESDPDAEEMEALERKALARLGIADPYRLAK